MVATQDFGPFGSSPFNGQDDSRRSCWTEPTTSEGLGMITIKKDNIVLPPEEEKLLHPTVFFRESFQKKILIPFRDFGGRGLPQARLLSKDRLAPARFNGRFRAKNRYSRFFSIHSGVKYPEEIGRYAPATHRALIGGGRRTNCQVSHRWGMPAAIEASTAP